MVQESDSLNGEKGGKSGSAASKIGGKGKPEDPPTCCGRLRCLFRCFTGTIKRVFFCCLPCIDYCCFDTKRCMAAIETCSCSCIMSQMYVTCCGPFIDCYDLLALPEFEMPCGKDAEDWGDGGSYDVRLIFWDMDGNLRLGNSLRNRDDEIISMLKGDQEDTEIADTIWMLIPSRWARKWVLFAHLRLSNEEPGPIDMLSLMTADSSEALGWRPKMNLRAPIKDSPDPEVDDAPGHYRRITLRAYKELERLYGVSGYPMAVWGEPYVDIDRWRIFERTSDVEKYAREECPIPEAVVQERELMEKEEASLKRRQERARNMEEKAKTEGKAVPKKGLLGFF